MFYPKKKLCNKRFCFENIFPDILETSSGALIISKLSSYLGKKILNNFKRFFFHINWN